MDLREPLADAAALVLGIVRELHAELQPGSRTAVRPDSSLDRDLGLDSLARVELQLRLESACGVSLPEQALMSAETVADVVRAVERAGHREQRGAGTPLALAAGSQAPWPDRAATLLEVLDWHVQAEPDRVHVHWVSEGPDETLSYGALDAGAGRVAAHLAERGLAAGETVGIMLPTGRAYLESFFGILRAGGVPVPIYPPARLSQIEDHVQRHAGILSNAQTALLITVPEAKTLARLLRDRVSTLRAVVTSTELAAAAAGAAPRVKTRAEDLAFLQYTSGSTGHPKGVMLTHANLLASIRAMGHTAGVRRDDVYVSWLPLYHDMGLIASWLTSLYYGLPFMLMSPFHFLTRPARWLWAIQRYRGTLSGAPNFAYELCARRIPDADVEGLDLSSWRIAYNGSEPVSPDTVAAFSERFAPHGFRPEAMTPAYGLAECVVGLTAPPIGRALRVDRVDRARFAATGEAAPAAADDAHALRFVSCGTPLPGHQVRIAGDAGVELPERREGRVEFCGPSATQGYFRNAEQTRALVGRDGWLDTGDLGYVAGGELYLTGRAKDLVIRGGRHIHPHELEAAVGAVPGVRRGCVAAFGSPDPRTGTERLIVLAESGGKDEPAREALRRRIVERCVDLIGMPPDDVVVAPPQTVLKTSSGKIRRAASREVYERRGASVHRRAAWWQIVRLGAASLAPELRRALGRLVAWAYAGYALLLFALAALIGWPVVVLLPRLAWRWAALRLTARALLALGGIRVTTAGLEHIPRDGGYVLVANHSSYIDGLILSALWPQRLRYLAKVELARQFFAGRFLRRLGAEFVERFDLAQGAADAQRLSATTADGAPLAVFPEGTFTRRPGLAAFHLGAFAVAVRAQVPVVPVTLRGTRSILRGDSRFARRGDVGLIVGAPIAPGGDDWHATVALCAGARRAILATCGEPDLAE